MVTSKKHGFVDSKFDLNLRCTCCNGSGIATCEVNIHALLDLMAPYYSKGLKIDAIKALRAYYVEGDIGLKTAKEIVESCFNFYANLESILVENARKRDPSNG